MLLRFYLFTLYVTLFITTGLLGMVLFNLDPFTSPFWVISLFYIVLFCFVLSFFAIVMFYLKVWASNREVIFAHLVPTLRQSALISLVLVTLLFLQQLRVLNWWVGSLVIVAIIFIELYFRKSQYAR